MAIRRVLVANRGEIALRVFRTCRRLGLETVAVVASDDRGAAHARAADTTVEIASYLEAGEHVRAAREGGADAVHPGYGFLSERADFAEAVEAAGLTWVGPPASALHQGGDKLAAKRIASAAGVPVLPQGEPREVGYPLLVKAAAGGGGRGMRIVRTPAELDDALAAARREAEAAFGDGTVFCERFLERPRHVEVQLLADAHGTVLALGERDCSVQRRHQKIVEETPAPGLSGPTSARLAAAATTFAAAIGYRSAGTAEFLVDGDEAFFLELNGRIQVEHPVTEEVTGLDLVEQQLRIASGESLATISYEARGHAVEARLYAEDPVSFLPQAGRVERLRLPGTIRIDAGVEEGDEVPLAYDPMIAKLVAHGRDRDEALDRLAAALAETQVEGVVTNLPFLRWLVAHPVFRGAELSTAFLLEHPPLSAPARRLPPRPWRGAWRLNLPSPPPAPPPDATAAAHAHESEAHGGTVTAPMPGTVIEVRVAAGDAVTARAALVVLEAMKMEVPVAAPFDARVASVAVAPGDRVAGGAVLVELE
ncbi:MAG TPA: biotin carboxylase N-terminal domain-containing protein [Gaiellaceae bacterium]|nr:biotin carboxylase N-terminal domain-containing protein [Gaiellaceae bacterium]